LTVNSIGHRRRSLSVTSLVEDETSEIEAEEKVDQEKIIQDEVSATGKVSIVCDSGHL